MSLLKNQEFEELFKQGLLTRGITPSDIKECEEGIINKDFSNLEDAIRQKDLLTEPQLQALISSIKEDFRLKQKNKAEEKVVNKNEANEKTKSVEENVVENSDDNEDPLEKAMNLKREGNRTVALRNNP